MEGRLSHRLFHVARPYLEHCLLRFARLYGSQGSPSGKQRKAWAFSSALARPNNTFGIKACIPLCNTGTHCVYLHGGRKSRSDHGTGLCALCPRDSTGPPQRLGNTWGSTWRGPVEGQSQPKPNAGSEHASNSAKTLGMVSPAPQTSGGGWNFIGDNSFPLVRLENQVNGVGGPNGTPLPTWRVANQLSWPLACTNDVLLAAHLQDAPYSPFARLR